MADQPICGGQAVRHELRAWLWLVLDDSRGGLATLAIAVAVR